MPLDLEGTSRLSLVPTSIIGDKEGYACPYCQYEVVPDNDKARCGGCWAEWYRVSVQSAWMPDKPPWLPTRLETLLLWNR